MRGSTFLQLWDRQGNPHTCIRTPPTRTSPNLFCNVGTDSSRDPQHADNAPVVGDRLRSSCKIGPRMRRRHRRLRELRQRSRELEQHADGDGVVVEEAGLRVAELLERHELSEAPILGALGEHVVRLLDDGLSPVDRRVDRRLGGGEPLLVIDHCELERARQIIVVSDARIKVDGNLPARVVVAVWVDVDLPHVRADGERGRVHREARERAEVRDVPHVRKARRHLRACAHAAFTGLKRRAESRTWPRSAQFRVAGKAPGLVPRAALEVSRTWHGSGMEMSWKCRVPRTGRKQLRRNVQVSAASRSTRAHRNAPVQLISGSGLLRSSQDGIVCRRQPARAAMRMSRGRPEWILVSQRALS
mmetsp:Transcript_5995/g.13899  ORF Transcript_5995/g.13899 Transcript_5995/m.13899 type:complete len:360 (-) Transcript_5995:141-1220(-)